jgi:hypothetical protein
MLSVIHAGLLASSATLGRERGRRAMKMKREAEQIALVWCGTRLSMERRDGALMKWGRQPLFRRGTITGLTMTRRRNWLRSALLHGSRSMGCALCPLGPEGLEGEGQSTHRPLRHLGGGGRKGRITLGKRPKWEMAERASHATPF